MRTLTPCALDCRRRVCPDIVGTPGSIETRAVGFFLGLNTRIVGKWAPMPAQSVAAASKASVARRATPHAAGRNDATATATSPGAVSEERVALFASQDAGTGTDGGEVDFMGLVPLLRDKKTTILAFDMEPRSPDTSQLRLLFGVPFDDPANSSPPGSGICYGTPAAASGVAMQVFDASLWPGVLASMMSPNNTGLTSLSNVAVLANPALGIDAYTIDKLMIVDNVAKAAFESSVLTADALARVKELNWPYGESLSVPQELAISLSLDIQWKLEQNAVELQAAMKV